MRVPMKSLKIIFIAALSVVLLISSVLSAEEVYKAVLIWGTKGSGKGQFNAVYGLAVIVDASGSVYIADSGNHRIQKFIKGSTIK